MRSVGQQVGTSTNVPGRPGSAPLPTLPFPSRSSLPAPPRAPRTLASQGIVLVLLMVRLVHHVSFQPRLSVISGTLARMLPDLVNFLVVLVALLTALGMALCVLWGGSVPGLGTPGQAVAWAMQYFVNGAGQADSASVIDAIQDVSGIPYVLGRRSGTESSCWYHHAPELHLHGRICCMLKQCLQGDKGCKCR